MTKIQYKKADSSVAQYVGQVESETATHLTLKIEGESDKRKMFRCFIKAQIVSKS